MKGKRTDLGEADCAIARSLGIIGDWWSLLIVRDAIGGKQRFGEFQKGLGLAKNILSTRLKKLVEQGIFTIESDRESPAFHRYVLTEKGEQLSVVLIALWQWGERTCFKPSEFKFNMVDKARGQPLAELELKTRDGRPLGPRDFAAMPKKKPGAGASRRGR